MLEKLNGWKSILGFIVYGVYNAAIAMWPELGGMLPPAVMEPLLQGWIGVGLAHKMGKMGG
jgi:hypothetical protein